VDYFYYVFLISASLKSKLVSLRKHRIKVAPMTPAQARAVGAFSIE
jgi:hypothetical protein